MYIFTMTELFLFSSFPPSSVIFPSCDPLLEWRDSAFLHQTANFPCSLDWTISLEGQHTHAPASGLRLSSPVFRPWKKKSEGESVCIKGVKEEEEEEEEGEEEEEEEERTHRA